MIDGEGHPAFVRPHLAGERPAYELPVNNDHVGTPYPILRGRITAHIDRTGGGCEIARADTYDFSAKVEQGTGRRRIGKVEGSGRAAGRVLQGHRGARDRGNGALDIGEPGQEERIGQPLSVESALDQFSPRPNDDHELAQVVVWARCRWSGKYPGKRAGPVSRAADRRGDEAVLDHGTRGESDQGPQPDAGRPRSLRCYKGIVLRVAA